MFSSNIDFNGSVHFHNNFERCHYVLKFQSCNISFNYNLLISSNICDQVIAIISEQKSAYIQIMEYSNTTFTQNNYTNLIAIQTKPAYNNPYPLCLFQYVTLHNPSKVSPSHYIINISDSFLYMCKLSFHQLFLIVSGYLLQHFLAMTPHQLTNRSFMLTTNFIILPHSTVQILLLMLWDPCVLDKYYK